MRHKFRKYARQACLGTLLLTQIACQFGGSGSPNGSDGPLQTLSAPSQAELSALADSALIEANTRFALKLFQDLHTEQSTDNLFVSPLSLSVALSMLYHGAEAETQSQMAQALAYNDLSETEIREGNLTLRKRLYNSGKGVEILLANALWGRQGLRFNTDFLSQNKLYYNANLESLDFEAPSALERINAWASENTKGLIPRVLEEIDPQAILLLMNAIYFKGHWTDPFEAEQTQTRPFHQSDGQTLEHPMMSRRAKWRYTHNSEGQFQAVSLPYGPEEESEMLIFLPDPGQNLSDWSAQLTPENWQAWLHNLRSREGHVVLPRFKLKTELQLNESLKRLGMEKAFIDGEAELGKLLQDSPLRPFVSKVKQDAFIEVNEQGTEAAAVTTITVGATSIQLPQEPFEMVMDRPFAYVIYDRKTQSILFMGTLQTPKL